MPTVVLNTTETTYVSSALPDNNFSFYPSLFTGTDATYQACIGFLKFDLAAIPVKSADSAYLQLSVIAKTGTVPSRIEVNRVTSEFARDTVTYRTLPDYTASSGSAQVTGQDLYANILIDITPLVNQWLSGTYSNYGMALVNSDGLSAVQFATNNIVYEPYFPKLLVNYSSSPVETRAYAYIYNTGNPAVDPEGNIPLPSNGILNGITHATGSDPMNIDIPGTYAVWFSATGLSVAQFALYQNSNLVPGSVYGTGAPQPAGNTGMVIVNAAAGDRLEVKSPAGTDHSAPGNAAEGLQANVNASILIMRIGPVSHPDQTLAPVNLADTVSGMKTAIAAPSLGLKLDAFNSLASAQQEQILGQLLSRRPSQGYFSMCELQSGLDAAVEYSVDSMNIYVVSGAQNGAGNPRHPFGTLPRALEAVLPGGTVHISGIFDITGNINVDKEGITLAGEGNPQLIIRSSAVPVSLSADHINLKGITFICDTNYQTSLIEISGSRTSIMDCNILGPGKPDTPSAYEDGITVYENVSEFNIENNNINSLRKGINVLGNSSGTVQFNIVSNTVTGISIGSGAVNLSGNAWGSLPNTSDIEFPNRTARPAPYDNLYRITALNNNAKIAGQN